MFLAQRALPTKASSVLYEQYYILAVFCTYEEYFVLSMFGIDNILYQQCSVPAGRKMVFERLPTSIKPLNYKLQLQPDLEKLTFQGEEEIQLDVRPTTTVPERERERENVCVCVHTWTCTHTHTHTHICLCVCMLVGMIYIIYIYVCNISSA